MSNVNQDANLQYPQDVTPENRRGIAVSVKWALDERFPAGWTVGPMGGAWFAWDHVGNVVGFAASRKDCIDAAIKNNKPAWYKDAK